MDGRELGPVEALRDGAELLLPLRATCELLEIRFVRAEHGGARLVTPLGGTEIPVDEIESVSGTAHVRAATLAQRLAARLSFDEARYALDWRLPWRIGAAAGRRGRALRPDVGAPASVLTGLRGTLTHFRTGDHAALSGDVLARGRLEQGLWKVWAQDSTTAALHVREYQWFTRRERFGYMAGRQALRLHPALADFDVAGLQFGWGNGPPGAALDFESSLLEPRRARPQETFRGSAPPGSFVELRIDGRVVATRQVGFAGTFEFYNVALPSRQITAVEMLVYEPHNRRIPVEIRRARLASSELLLPEGTMLHTGGFGWTGRFTRGLVGTAENAPGRPGAFYQWRQGLSGNLTVEAATQLAAGRPQSFLGLVGRPDESWIVSAGLSVTPGALGHRFDLEGFGRRFRLYLRSHSMPGEFHLTGAGTDRSDHSAELLFDVSPRLRVGAVARVRDDGFRGAEYLAPVLTWRPLPALYLDTRPDLYGEHLVSAAWQGRSGTRLRLFTSEASTVELSQRIGQRWEASLGTDFGGGLPTRQTLSAIWLPRRAAGWSARAGLVRATSGRGYLASVSAPMLPGVHLRAEYQSIPYRTSLDEPEPGRFLLAISTDLGHAAGRMVPARTLAFRQGRGALGGRIVVPSVRGRAGSLDRVAILVDGRVRTRTDSGGRYYVADLERGPHVVELDPEHLPIELRPLRSRVVAEIAPGAVTRVDFAVRAEFGVAGRVHGPAAAGVRVELVDASGAIVAAGRTDGHGFYRLDAIPPGTYTLRARADHDGPVLAERGVVLEDDFLFEQNLDLPDDREPSLRPAATDS